MVGTEFTTIVSACSSKTPVVSVTRTVKAKLPVAVGVPLITPDVVFKTRPAGRAPVTIDQVNGVVPPVVVSVRL